MFSQLKEVEVPEELVDTHIKALKFALYSKQLESFVPANASDPLGDLANFGKIEAFISVLSQFIDNVQADFQKYGVNYDDQDFIEKMKNYGIEVNPSDIQTAASLLNTAGSVSNTTGLNSLSSGE